MQYRRLGRTDIRISELSFGAGPVSGLMVGDGQDEQLLVVQRALEQGVNWFDTAATYGDGQSEKSLGSALKHLDAFSQTHIATKVRLMPEELDEIPRYVRDSILGSLERLGVERVTLLQLHNSITEHRGDEPTSLCPSDILSPGGILEALEDAKRMGLVEHIGLTGIGQPRALREVIASGAFDTIQTPYNLLNPSSGRSMPDDFAETDYGNIIADCAREDMGVLAIRVFAAGALLGNEPGAHTKKTLFFPLDLYQRDLQRAGELNKIIGNKPTIPETALRFVLGHRDISSALIGFGAPSHVDEAVSMLQAGSLSPELLKLLES